MAGIQVIGFQKEFPTVNLKVKNEDEKRYEYLILMLYTLESENGYMVKKVGKTTNKGTKVNYISFKTDEDVKKYSELLQGMIKAFNKKWDTTLKLECDGF
jgi:hypothetical protein